LASAGEAGQALPDPGEDAQALVNLANAMTEAARLTALAVPPLHEISFEGMRDVQVTLGDQLLGVTPFRLNAPVLPDEVEVALSRPGYRSATRNFSLSEERVDVALHRRRQAQEEDSTEDAPPAHHSPFGSAPITPPTNP
jgi:hypothetical protein